jgi:putative hydrolase of the HAD superfamily
MKKAVLFDLGNTLAYYFEMHEFPEILKQAITEVQNHLLQKDLLRVSLDDMWLKVREEDYESSDHSVRPLEERLVRIFRLDDLSQSIDFIMTICRCFMKPIFSRGHLYQDALPTLEELKSMDFQTAIVSNTTWGSPAGLWREEIELLGLSAYVDAVVFCRDVGWRKPARQIFEYTLEKLQVLPRNCVFVGDDPRWDLVGPRAVGITPMLIDRREVVRYDQELKPIKSLNELPGKLRLFWRLERKV